MPIDKHCCVLHIRHVIFLLMIVVVLHLQQSIIQYLSRFSPVWIFFHSSLLLHHVTTDDRINWDALRSEWPQCMWCTSAESQRDTHFCDRFSKMFVMMQSTACHPLTTDGRRAMKFEMTALPVLAFFWWACLHFIWNLILSFESITWTYFQI